MDFSRERQSLESVVDNQDKALPWDGGRRLIRESASSRPRPSNGTYPLTTMATLTAVSFSRGSGSHLSSHQYVRNKSLATAPALSTAVVLRVGCWNVVKRDLFSESDPFIIEELHQQQPLGCAEFTMAELMTTKGLSLELTLGQPPNEYAPGLKGTVSVSAEELSACTDQVTIQFGADNLDKKNSWLGKSDPFLSILRLRDADADPSVQSSWLQWWKSEVIKSELNPRWKKSTISVRSLCNGDLTKVLHFQCWDWERDGGHELIGACSITAGEFLSSKNSSWTCSTRRSEPRGARSTSTRACCASSRWRSTNRKAARHWILWAVGLIENSSPTLSYWLLPKY